MRTNTTQNNKTGLTRTTKRQTKGQQTEKQKHSNMYNMRSDETTSNGQARTTTCQTKTKNNNVQNMTPKGQTKGNKGSDKVTTKEIKKDK